MDHPDRAQGDAGTSSSAPLASSAPRPLAHVASSSPSSALGRIWDRFSPPSIPSPFSASSPQGTPPIPPAFLSRSSTPHRADSAERPDVVAQSQQPGYRDGTTRGRPTPLEQHDSASQLSFVLRRASASSTPRPPDSSSWESPFRLPSLPWKGKDRERDRPDEAIDHDDDMVDDEACFVDGWEGKVDFIVSLPSELSLNILLQLDFRSVLASSAVSHGWRQLALDPLLWRSLFHDNPRWHIKPDAYRQAARAAAAAQAAAAAAASAATPSGSADRERTSSYFAHDRPVMPNLKRAASSFGRAGAKRLVTGADRVQAGGAVIGRKLSEMVGELGSLSIVPGSHGASSTSGPPTTAGTSTASSRAHSPERSTPTRPRTGAGAGSPSTSNATPSGMASSPSLLGAGPAGPGQPSLSAVQTHAFASPPSASLSRTSSSSALSTLASMSTPRRSVGRSSLGTHSAHSAQTPSTPGVSALPDTAEAALMYAAGLLALDWPRLYRDRWLLEQRWATGKPSWSWFEGHADSVYCVQFDERKVVSGSRDQTVRIWDLASGTTTATLKGHEGSVLCLQYDNKILVTGSSDSRVVVWDLVGDVATGRGRHEILRTLVGHSMGVLDLCFDDKWIVSCSKDTKTRVWNRSTGELYRVLHGHRGPVNAVQLHGDRVLTASGDALMKLWDVHTGATLRTFTGHSRGLACVNWGPSGKEFVSSSNDKTIKLWNADTGECIRTFTGHSDLVRGLAWDERSRRIVSGGYDHTTRVWDAETGEELHRFRSHSSLVFDVAFSASAIVSSSHDKRILVMDFGVGLDVSKFA
ncbi:hypothetical protein JCM3775_006316 [Rhodotorula graminis]